MFSDGDLTNRQVRYSDTHCISQKSTVKRRPINSTYKVTLQSRETSSTAVFSLRKNCSFKTKKNFSFIISNKSLNDPNLVLSLPTIQRKKKKIGKIFWFASYKFFGKNLTNRIPDLLWVYHSVVAWCTDTWVPLWKLQVAFPPRPWSTYPLRFPSSFL